MADSSAGRRHGGWVPSVPPIDPRVSTALGTRLREVREAAGLNQEDVAHAAGISRNHLQLIEQGRSDRSSGRPWNPHLSVLVALCDALDINVAAITIDVFGPPPGYPAVEFVVDGHFRPGPED